MTLRTTRTGLYGASQAQESHACHSPADPGDEQSGGWRPSWAVMGRGMHPYEREIALEHEKEQQ